MVDSPRTLRNVPSPAICGLRHPNPDSSRTNRMPFNQLRRLLALGLFLVSPLLVPGSAVAQDGDGDGTEPPEALTGDAAFGLTVTEGNAETLSLNFSGRIAYALHQHTWQLSTGLLRTTTDDEVRASRGNVAFQYDFEPSERFFLNSQFRAAYNRPAGIDRRLVLGLGVGYDVWRGEVSRLSLDAGLNRVGERFTDDTRESSIYFNLEQEFRLRVNATTDLEQKFSYSPRPENLSDYLVYASLAMTTQVWKMLGIKTQITDEYDSTPFVDPETGEARARNDFTFITGLNVSF